MSNPPHKPCIEPGCPYYATTRGRCARHHSARRRATPTIHRAVYARKRWTMTRRRQLRDHPLCETPGCDRNATDVHHIVDLSDGGDPWDPANLQSLCHVCHARITGGARY